MGEVILTRKVAEIKYELSYSVTATYEVQINGLPEGCDDEAEFIASAKGGDYDHDGGIDSVDMYGETDYATTYPDDCMKDFDSPQVVGMTREIRFSDDTYEYETLI
tara:strand:+ start:193 stop:510 length:318 start_codon:yes stop_codon:yes gene_type:complete